MSTSRTKEVKLLKQLIREMLTDPRPPITNVEVGGSLANDEEDEMLAALNAPRAACVLVRNPNGKILAVSRKDDPNALGMPGGHVDIGEKDIDAARRELKEETGLDVTDLVEIFSMRDSHGFMTTTFSGNVSGTIHTNESGVIRWVNPSSLIDPNQSPFYRYNQLLFQKISIL